MESHSEKLTELFLNWEMLGRGTLPVCDDPVFPEPPFRPFTGYRLPRKAVVDDGRRHTAISAFLEEAQLPAPTVEPEDEEPELQFSILDRSSMVELSVTLPPEFSATSQVFENFLLSLDRCEEPVAVELFGTGSKISFQFAAAEPDAVLVRSQLEAFFPEAVITVENSSLEGAWAHANSGETAIFECGLADSFYLPLATGRVDSFIGFAGALSELRDGDFGLIQVIFQPTRFPWKTSMLASVFDEDGQLIFKNAAGLAKAAENKVAKPLFGTVVRLAARCPNYDRLTENLRRLASPLRVFSNANGNELIPLPNDDYSLDEHVEDLLVRRSRRFGMLLNADELLGFVHLPSKDVRSQEFERITAHSKAAPPSLVAGPGIALGENSHRGDTNTVYLSPDNRVRHMHVVGSTGTGKSTLLLNMIRQDLESGQGIAVIDPHGELVDDVLKCIPESRIDDVVLLDPSDEAGAVPFNLLEAHSDTEKNLLASDLVSVFQRLSTSWGDQMTIVLRNAILAFLESERGGTLSDLKRFLMDDKFRDSFLETVQDQEVVSFWRNSFTKLTGNKSIGPLLIRLEMFLSMKPVRRIVAQPGNALDFANIMDDGKIFLARLSQGLIGKENAYLLGSLLVAKFQQIIMSRQAQEAEARRDFWFYADEFHQVITQSVADILTGARKYRLGMILAHQELRQLKRDDEVASAVFSIGGVRVVFRVSDGDAKTLESGFAAFDARDLTTQEIGHAICRVERSDQDFNLAVPWTDAPENGAERRLKAIEASRRKYATPREEIEAQLKKNLPTRTAKAMAPSPSKSADEPEAQSAQANAPTEPEEKKPEPAPSTRSSGRGGADHKEIQNRVKKAAQALNFKATIEKKILEGKGIDVLLERDDETIAVEICISTTTSHELDNNIQKCLDAGYASIFLLSPDESRINTISKALRKQFPPEATAGIRCMTPDEFVVYLDSLSPRPPSPKSPPPLPGEKSRRGWEVKRTFPDVTPGDAQTREKEVLSILEDAMRSPEPGKQL